MEEELIFVGYRQFTSSKNNKDYFVIDFITKPKKAFNSDNVLCKNIAIFVDDKKFDNFIKSNKLLSIVKVPFEINGDKVNYLI